MSSWQVEVSRYRLRMYGEATNSPTSAAGSFVSPKKTSQFINNFVTVHTRTAFVDDAQDPARQRHLLRLWISRPEAGRPLCPEYAV